mgnify:CR=1 FL=1
MSKGRPVGTGSQFPLSERPESCQDASIQLCRLYNSLNCFSSYTHRYKDYLFQRQSLERPRYFRLNLLHWFKMSDTKEALESLEGSETKEVLTKSSFPEGGVKGWLTVLSGLTNGLTYTPAVTAINQYFFQKRPIAMGIASSGSSPPGVIFPIALNSMLNNKLLIRMVCSTFGVSHADIEYYIPCCSLIACVSGAPFLLAAWKHPQYYLQILGLFLMFWGLFVPSFYVPGYAESIGLQC